MTGGGRGRLAKLGARFRARFWSIVIVGTALVFVGAGAVGAAPTYPALTGRVVDDAHVLTPQAVAELTQKLSDLEQSTGRQLVVATVASLQGDAIEDYGVGLLRTWKIGDKATNSGAILIVAPADRQVRVEVGYGLEGILTDALSERIIQRDLLPKFRAGDIVGGVEAGTDGLIAQLRLPDDQARAAVAAASVPEPTRSRGYGHSPFGAVFGLLLIFWIFGGLFGRNRRYGGGRGGGLGWLLPMIVLNGLGRGGSGGWDGDGGGDGGGGGGFSGGGGSGGGGGASGSW